MSLSPTATTSNSSDVPSKRRRTNSIVPINNSQQGMTQSPAEGSAHPPPSQSLANIPKRGARACTACRKGKNRCEGEAPCRRCQLSGTPCIFEKPEKKVAQPVSGASVEYVHIEKFSSSLTIVMQSQMIGMQSSLDRILSAVQSQGQPSNQQPGYTTSVRQGSGRDVGPSYPPRSRFPPLPGFAPPPHKYATYGIVPSTAASSEDESEDTLPRATLNAPIEALQGLANAAAEAAAAPSTAPPIMKKRQRAEPIPRNAFPHVIEKGLVPEAEAKELYHIFFAGCHLFIPLFDPNYDTLESLMERTPWTFDAILAIASKIRSGNAPLGATFYKCLEEAQGIARSSLFGPVISALHRALEKLADESGKQRSEEEERDLVVSARIWLCLYWFDHQMSLGTGRPIVLRDECSIKHCRLLLTHPMASPTDVRLISLVELIAQKTQIYETLAPLNGEVNHNTLAFIRRANVALDKWWADCDELHRQTMDEESLLRKILAGELHYAKLWLVCVALRGVSWDKMPFEQRELAFQAKDAAFNCLSIFLNSTAYRAALRYAVHDSLVTLAFSGLFLLKMANLFPTELDLAAITSQVEQLAQLLSDVAAERSALYGYLLFANASLTCGAPSYALTLRIMIANLRRKVGMHPGIAAPIQNLPPPLLPEGMVGPYVDTHAMGPPPLTMEELGFSWPGDRGMFNPSTIPVWIQEQSLTDLGLPVNGSDGIFLNMHGTNGWSGDFAPMPEAW
ncbi:hypothetical protein J3R83DRAFT_3612 [Lanmaoa asiatica]|nr:hypothetical protein J3R83DRAFT_3612 [Lanmaoa asiatica]